MNSKINTICCIGAGYVGGPTMSVIAMQCPDLIVHVVDIDSDRIAKWNSENLDDLPIYEKGLDEVIRKSRGRNLFFSTDIEKAIKESEMIFLAVNTPTKSFGIGKGEASDLRFIELAARTIARVAESDKIIIEKSTLPVRTAQTLKSIFSHLANPDLKFEILSNPEFLAEGTAIEDLLNADRVLIGGENTESGNYAQRLLSSIYGRWLDSEKILLTNVWSSELSKLVANAFLAQRISSINSISALCEKTEANISEVARAIGKDSRIGDKFLNASVGFGGSCFRKDILNLIYICRSFQLDEVADYWEGVIKINEYQGSRFADLIIHQNFNTISDKIIVLFGWAFKKNTNDTRESAAIQIADRLINEKAHIVVVDPKVSQDQMISDLSKLGTRSEKLNEKHLKKATSPYEAVKNAHSIAILTEWDEFISYDYSKIYKNMTKPAFIFDGRRLLDHDNLKSIGFQTFNLGE